MSCDRMIRLASSGAPLQPPPTRTAAEVSSHDVSMPSRTSATARLLAQGDRVGNGPGGDAAWGDDSEAGGGARCAEPAPPAHDSDDAVPTDAAHDGVVAAHDAPHACP